MTTSDSGLESTFRDDVARGRKARWTAPSRPSVRGEWWQADPNDGSVLVFLSHNMVELGQLAQGIGLGAWSATATFHGWRESARHVTHGRRAGEVPMPRAP